MKIIAFVDGSAYSASVCDHAAWTAERLSADVEIFHVMGRRLPSNGVSDLSGNLNLGARTALLEKLAAADEEWAHLAQARGRMVLDDASARTKQHTDKNVGTRLRYDDFVETIKDFESDADVIVLGKRGDASGYAREHLGSNLERALRSASKPVLVANFAFTPIKTCLIAYDGGSSIEKAICHPALGKLLQGTTCTLLHVGAATTSQKSQMAAAIETLTAQGIDAEIVERDGDPESVIPRVAKERDAHLLVMGAYGHSRVRNLIIGSTTTSVVQSCRIPILMFR